MGNIKNSTKQKISQCAFQKINLGGSIKADRNRSSLPLSVGELADNAILLPIGGVNLLFGRTLLWLVT